MAVVGTLYDEFPGGIAPVDCRGWDMMDSTTQTVPGIYRQVDEAYKSGKMIVMFNGTITITGESDHFVSSPVQMKTILGAAGYVVNGGTTLISDDDTITRLS